MAGRDLIETPSQKFLLERLRYEPSTGKLYWKSRPRTDFDTARGWRMWQTKFPGREAGTVDNSNRYPRLALSGSRYFCHRIIWKMLHGEDCENRVCHLDGDPGNNREGNLIEELLLE